MATEAAGFLLVKQVSDDTFSSTRLSSGGKHERTCLIGNQTGGAVSAADDTKCLSPSSFVLHLDVSLPWTKVTYLLARENGQHFVIMSFGHIACT